jgi:hypothetical protein
MPSPSDLFLIVDELFQERPGSPFNADGSRDYTRKFLVVVKRKGLSVATVCSAPGLPAPWSSYIAGSDVDGITEFDPSALLIKYSAEPQSRDDWQNWIVTANYSTNIPAGGEPFQGGGANAFGNQRGGAGNNPEMEAPEVEWDADVQQRAPLTDLDGFAFVTSADQPFYPAPQFEYANAVLTITRNELGFNWQTAMQYAFAVNKEKILGADPECVLCLPPRAKWTWRGKTGYYRVTYKLRFGALKDDGVTLEKWQAVVLDAGTMKRETRMVPNPLAGTAGQPAQIRHPKYGQPVPIYNGQGHPVTTPVLLDGRGNEAPMVIARKPNGEPIVDDDGVPIERKKPSYLTFRIRRKMSFRRLFERGVAGRV